MPHRGWQTVEVPAGWFEVSRGRRPSRTVRPTGATVPHRQFPPVATRCTPEEALQAAHAISAVPALQESVRQARKHAQLQPVENRIKSSEFFIERAKKRVEHARKEVEDAKAKVVAAEMTLTSEVRALQDGEQRHASLLAETSRVSEEPPPTMPVDFVAELAQLRSLVAVRVGAARCCHTSRGGSPTQVNSVVVNTSIRFDGATQPTGDQRREWSEPVSVDGNIDRRRISSGVTSIVHHAAVANGPCACLRRESRYGLRGVRVGEASHPGPPRPRRRGISICPRLKWTGTFIDDDERLLPRRPADAVGEAASRARDVPTGRASVPVREFDIGMDDSSSDTESVATVPEPPPSCWMRWTKI